MIIHCTECDEEFAAKSLGELTSCPMCGTKGSLEKAIFELVGGYHPHGPTHKAKPKTRNQILRDRFQALKEGKAVQLGQTADYAEVLIPEPVTWVPGHYLQGAGIPQ